ncbi:glycosyltransferase [Nodosilinea sp. LEGE 07298]|uniref:glycosyltransferase family 2 protein n=1 Tax=Nodosilinea sp. LEGE 07298 TaxID=2777970 RepID=UPI0028BD2F07|nr:glycosyltransferase [Nodosilinea sp. LEGE 07298]
MPVYNGGSAFSCCLKSLAGHLPAPHQVTTKIIAIADGCHDCSNCLAEQFGAKSLRMSGPSGLAKAKNLGAQIAQSNMLFFVDFNFTIHANTKAQS